MKSVVKIEVEEKKGEERGMENRYKRTKEEGRESSVETGKSSTARFKHLFAPRDLFPPSLAISQIHTACDASQRRIRLRHTRVFARARVCVCARFSNFSEAQGRKSGDPKIRTVTKRYAVDNVDRELVEK